MGFSQRTRRAVYGSFLAIGLGLWLSTLAAGPSAAQPVKLPIPKPAEEKPQEAKPEAYHPEPSRHADAPKRELKVSGPRGAKVLRIPIEGTIDLGLSAFVERALASHADAAVVVLDINTFGGRVDAAIKIRDALLAHKARTVAFIHPRAISAGALISLACDVIAMTSGATMGAVTPMTADGSGQSEAVEEKMTSYMRTEMRSTAEAKGRRGDIAEAMVDRSVAIEGIVEGGKLLTLDTDRALKLNIADVQVESLSELLQKLGLDAPKVQDTQENWAEKIARFLTDPTVSGLLMSLGMLGLLIELYSPGVGLPGAVGVVCLVLFFGGHTITNLAGLEELLLMAAGLILVAVEIFVLPGFGIAGIAGAICIGASFVLTLLALPVSVAWDLGLVGEALERVSLSFLITLVLGVIAARFLPRTRAARGLVLSEATRASEGYASAPAETALLGVIGEAITDLHPSGKAELGGVRHDVVTEGEYIERNTKVVVVEAAPGRLVVRKSTAGHDH
jgi:membrane-bound serine protease (ClpP class)